ncbi:1-aminocyclopropane-1-carboxylate synthase-like [Olea europaea var. sylvestris]|uniref:1-aminocyclopropane-1-carboxylate synthase 1 n=1 Tax=Olea europaea subsp. europaea TaxID=158383 RepID=A0A8S0PAZ8_OLEEU|nr:1-aminocyclopropane-1-carboxylate synthase-like [Olea europaea var. sylvestris]CAA2934988.1 1-aminocyclopropane-1-carboxylate synthase 1 [Olea europaea subsp. europaea]
MEFKNGHLLSKLATNDLHGENSPYFDGWKAYDNNPFHPTQNSNGVIQMGLAENQLSFDLVEDWIKKNPRASICTSEGVNAFKDIAIFQDYHGLTEFRKAVASFMGKVRGGRVIFDPDRIVMAGGATGANELLMFCLADPGDAFLVPSPYYPAFDRDLSWRTGVKLLPIAGESSNNFQITIQALEEAYENAQKANIKVKGLIIANPSNPLGTTMDRDTLRSLVTFINEREIHLVCDEIYAATIFRAPNFVSISEIIEEVECNRDLIHIVYSLSKDMGIPGLRVGTVYSYNDAVVNCGRKMSSFGLVSSQTQHLLASMLADEEFIKTFLTESSKRLGKRHKSFTSGLEEVGIKCLKSNAGLFCWMDLRPLLKEPTFEGEMTLWRVIINDVKLNVSPGSSFHCDEPGWFRVCIANMDDETMEIALRRIRMFVGKIKDLDSQVQNKRWHRNLTLSSPSRIYCETSLSPRMTSPHSPIPRSPLVRTRT